MDLYRASGVGEYWVVDPDYKEITIYLFENKDIKGKRTYKGNEETRSNVFANLSFVEGIFFKNSRKYMVIKNSRHKIKSIVISLNVKSLS